MYREYTTRNLNEYRKIVAIVESCKNLDQLETVKNVIQQFGKNCDFRDNRLKNCIWKTLSLKAYREYKSYNISARVQIDHILEIYNSWVEQYMAWEEAELKAIEEEKEGKKKMPPKKDVSGFGSLLKKNKKKKNG